MEDQHRDWHTSVKGQKVNVLGFKGYTVTPIATSQLCCYGSKAATDNAQMSGCSCVPLKPYL